jgi:hypothetical protein
MAQKIILYTKIMTNVEVGVLLGGIDQTTGRIEHRPKYLTCIEFNCGRGVKIYKPEGKAEEFMRNVTKQNPNVIFQDSGIRTREVFEKKDWIHFGVLADFETYWADELFHKYGSKTGYEINEIIRRKKTRKVFKKNKKILKRLMKIYGQDPRGEGDGHILSEKGREVLDTVMQNRRDDRNTCGYIDPYNNFEEERAKVYEYMYYKPERLLEHSTLDPRVIEELIEGRAERMREESREFESGLRRVTGGEIIVRQLYESLTEFDLHQWLNEEFPEEPPPLLTINDHQSSNGIGGPLISLMERWGLINS